MASHVSTPTLRKLKEGRKMKEMEKGKIRKSKSRREQEKKGGGMGERMKKIQEEN